MATLTSAVLTVFLVVGPLEVLLPFAVRELTGSGPGGFALVLDAWGAGALPLVVLGCTDQLWLMVVAALVFGVTDSAALAIWGTLPQRRVPPHLLGRVLGLDFFVPLGLMPVSMAVPDPVGEAIGITLTFLLAGTIPIVPTGLVKGWAVERATRALDLPARHSVLVNAGGDITAQGNGAAQGDDGKPWRVGIEDPADRSRILAVVPLRSGGVATSGDGRAGRAPGRPPHRRPTHGTAFGVGDGAVADVGRHLGHRRLRRRVRRTRCAPRARRLRRRAGRHRRHRHDLRLRPAHNSRHHGTGHRMMAECTHSVTAP